MCKRKINPDQKNELSKMQICKNYKIAKLQNCKITKLQNCKIAKLQK